MTLVHIIKGRGAKHKPVIGIQLGRMAIPIANWSSAARQTAPRHGGWSTVQCVESLASSSCDRKSDGGDRCQRAAQLGSIEVLMAVPVMLRIRIWGVVVETVERNRVDVDCILLQEVDLQGPLWPSNSVSKRIVSLGGDLESLCLNGISPPSRSLRPYPPFPVATNPRLDRRANHADSQLRQLVPSEFQKQVVGNALLTGRDMKRGGKSKSLPDGSCQVLKQCTQQ